MFPDESIEALILEFERISKLPHEGPSDRLDYDYAMICHRVAWAVYEQHKIEKAKFASLKLEGYEHV